MNQMAFTHKHIQLLDKRSIYDAILKRKLEKGWHNIEISQHVINELLEKNDWYELTIPESKLAFDDYKKVAEWQRIIIDLLTLHIDAKWKSERRTWENTKIKLFKLDKNSKNIPKQYDLRIDKREETLIKDTKKLAKKLETTEDYDSNIAIGACHKDFHAYNPLLYTQEKNGVEKIKVAPVLLNHGEAEFVRYLKKYLDSEEAKEAKISNPLLLRNLSRGRGVSLFNDYNFYPDFILWIKKEQQRHILFIDPKGLTHLDNKTRSKIQMHQKIKSIQKIIQNDNPNIYLHSYIWSVTRKDDIPNLEDFTLEDAHDKYGIYFHNVRNSEIGIMINSALVNL